MAKKPTPGFNTPFARLTRSPAKASPSAKPLDAPPKRAPPEPAAPTNDDDQRSFEQAMRGVKPLSAIERKRRADPLAGAGPAGPPGLARARPSARNDDADAEAELADLVTGPGRFTVDEASGTPSGRAAGVDRRIVRRLRAGDYPIEAKLDLHGRTRDEAEAAVDRFIAAARDAGRRCVLVIHGRGVNSGDDGPVLGEAVRRCLSEGRASRAVLAFTLAGPSQGADGATLVLLRKKK
jgi:DNA-nicking Smr family endonuclease